MITTIVFDIGGVLKGWHNELACIKDEEARKIVYEAIWESGLWNEMDLGIVPEEELIGKMLALAPGHEKDVQYMLDHLGLISEKYDYAIPWVKELKEKGYQVLFLSNYSHLLLTQVPETVGFLPYMDGGIFSHEVRLLKPDLRIYQLLCEQYHLNPSECLFIDDRAENVKGAIDAGMNAFVFENYEKSRKMILKMELEQEYPYLYETHLHTCRSSACARDTGWDMAKGAKAAGYTGMIVTEHNWGGNTSVDRSMPWEEWVTKFTAGYQEALAYGQEHDLDVFWGYEAGYEGTEFLIYGVAPEWMKKHPELKTCTIEEQFSLVHEAGGIVIHAHPYREEWYIPEIRLFPEYVDGVEAINATHSNSASKSHNDPEFNDRAIEYARKHHLPMTAGSDIHVQTMFGGGMRFKRKLRSIKDFCNAVLTRAEYILTDGERFYDADGNEYI